MTQLLQFVHFKNKYLFVKFFVFNLQNKIKLLPNDKIKTLPTLPFSLNPLSENQNIFFRWPKIYFKSMLLYSEVICSESYSPKKKFLMRNVPNEVLPTIKHDRRQTKGCYWTLEQESWKISMKRGLCKKYWLFNKGSKKICIKRGR